MVNEVMDWGKMLWFALNMGLFWLIDSWWFFRDDRIGSTKREVLPWYYDMQGNPNQCYLMETSVQALRYYFSWEEKIWVSHYWKETKEVNVVITEQWAWRRGGCEVTSAMLLEAVVVVLFLLLPASGCHCRIYPCSAGRIQSCGLRDERGED